MESKLTTIFHIITSKKEYTFLNNILDCGLDSLVTKGFSGISNYCNLGDGNSYVSVEQTGLDNCLYSVMKSSSTTGTDEGYYWKRDVFEFPNITGVVKEIGLSSSENSDYFNRQLIKDLQGNPVVIETIEGGEPIKVISELRLYTPPLNVWISLAPDFEIKFKPDNLWFNYPKSFFSSLGYNYVPGSFKKTSVYTRPPGTEETFTKDAPLSINSAVDIAISTAKPKDKELNIRLDWKWGRYAS